VLTLWYSSHDITVQHCIISECLYNSLHPNGPHSMGFLIGAPGTALSYNMSFHHNLIAHCNQRNPQITACNIGDLRNNVVYNWGELSGEYQELGNKINLVSNYYKGGPNIGAATHQACVNVAAGASDMQLYIAGNIDPTLDGTTVDNWPMVRLFSGVNPASAGRQVFTPFTAPTVDTMTATQALAYVLANSGATKPVRDSVDSRVVAEVQAGTGSIIDSQADVGGWPVLTTSAPPTDTDADGMPNSWEETHNLNASDPNDASADRDNDGYTNVEEYVNSIA
jgi:hypothetical protein